jgi:long-chain acyl-CoA synthetase
VVPIISSTLQTPSPRSDENGFQAFSDLLMRGHDRVRRGCRDYVDAALDPAAVSVLLFTSATTSEPKAVQLSHRNLCENLMAVMSTVRLSPGDIALSILPIHHTYECTCGFLCPVYSGAAIAFCDGLRHIPRNLKESGGTVMIVVPLVLETMYKRIWAEAEKKGAAGQLRLALKVSNGLRRIGVDLRRRRARPGGRQRLSRPGNCHSPRIWADGVLPARGRQPRPGLEERRGRPAAARGRRTDSAARP